MTNFKNGDVVRRVINLSDVDGVYFAGEPFAMKWLDRGRSMVIDPSNEIHSIENLELVSSSNREEAIRKELLLLMTQYTELEKAIMDNNVARATLREELLVLKLDELINTPIKLGK